MQCNIKINSLKEEFEQVHATIEKLPWFMDNYGSTSWLVLPTQEMQQAVKENDVFKFQQSCYNKLLLDEHLAMIQESWELLSRQVNIETILFTLNKNWSFKIFEQYNIFLTQYGAGGSYYCKTGNIIMRVPPSRICPAHTIFHEIIHIGIEECIIRKYNIRQMDKERIVDSICKAYLGESYVIKKLEENWNFSLSIEEVENNLEKIARNHCVFCE